MTRRFSPELEARIIAAYAESNHGARVAREFGIGETTVHRVLRRNGIQPISAVDPEWRTHRGRPDIRKFTPEMEAEIVRRYQAKELSGVLAAEYGCSGATIRKIIRRHGVEAGPRGARRREYSPEQLQEMAEMWRGGMSQEQIAQHFHTDQVKVSNALRLNGVMPEGRYAVRERHGSWKGGRRKDVHGYWTVRVEPDDPFASMAQSNGYVPEHRLVMARKLGRPLVSHETVHHINGDRDDNAPENLQLRKEHHGKGQHFVCLDCGSHNVVAAELA